MSHTYQHMYIRMCVCMCKHGQKFECQKSEIIKIEAGDCSHICGQQRGCE